MKKIKIKLLNNEKVFLSLERETFGELRDLIVDFMQDHQTELKKQIRTCLFSLNGTDPIPSSDNETLTQHGIVNGDLLIMMNNETQNVNASGPLDHISITVPSVSAPIKPNRKIPTCKDYMMEKLQQHLSTFTPSSLNEGLNLIVHLTMEENRFQLKEQLLPVSLKGPVITLDYTHTNLEGFSCTIVMVTSGTITQILVTHPGQKKEISTSLDSKKFAGTLPADSDSYHLGHILFHLNSHLIYPLRVSAHETVGITAPWLLAGLPTELLEHICSYLDYISLSRLGSTSKRLKEVSDTPKVWEKMVKNNCGNKTPSTSQDWKDVYRQHVIQERYKRIESERYREPLNPGFQPDLSWPPTMGRRPPLDPYNDPDSPYFRGEISMDPSRNPINRVIGDPFPLGAPNPDPLPMLPNPFNGPRRRNDPFSDPFVPNFGMGMGRGGGRGPRFDFL